MNDHEKEVAERDRQANRELRDKDLQDQFERSGLERDISHKNVYADRDAHDDQIAREAEEKDRKDRDKVHNLHDPKELTGIDKEAMQYANQVMDSEQMENEKDKARHVLDAENTK